MATTKYDDSWMRKVAYGGPPIDWDLAWNYYEEKRRAAREAARWRRDPALRLLARVNSPRWACQSERTSI